MMRKYKKPWNSRLIYCIKTVINQCGALYVMKYRYAIWNNPSDYEIFCFRKMWNKIRLLTFAKQIFHSEAISYAIAYFTRRRRISLKKKRQVFRLVFLFLSLVSEKELFKNRGFYMFTLFLYLYFLEKLKILLYYQKKNRLF